MPVEWIEAQSEIVRVKIIKPVKYRAGISSGTSIVVLPP